MGGVAWEKAHPPRRPCTTFRNVTKKGLAMRIESVKIANFRGYARETKIAMDDLTVFVGKNDIGKSSVLEALDIFFNDGKGAVKFDKSDVNVTNQKDGNQETSIAVVFAGLPDKIVIDTAAETTLKDSYLLNSENKLEIVKKYTGTSGPKIYIKALHPTNSGCSDLLLKKNADLKKMIKQYKLEEEVDTKNNVSMRAALWSHFSDDLKLQEIEIAVAKEDAKTIWSKLSAYMPVYSLFQADRENSDSDSEVQDPLKESVKEVLKDPTLEEELDKVAQKVRKKLDEVATRTVAKLKEVDPEVASSLNPVIPPSESLKWADVFKNVSITGDGDIPINKRGSGTKRLILLSFFRAEAERRLVESGTSGVIYAIEEPETSQHTENQKKLIEALQELSKINDVQVILTTHSPYIVKHLKFENLRLIEKGSNPTDRKISKVLPGQLRYPSLNEVNFIAFNESTEEYHDELYGAIDENHWLPDYRDDKERVDYISLWQGKRKEEKITMTDYIRHQIHHPENKENERYTVEQLHESICMMRDFIKQKRSESD